MSFGKFVATIAATLALTLGGWGLALRVPGESPAAAGAVFLGAFLAAANALAAYALVLWSRGKSSSTFVRAILGGMTIRMGLLIVAVFAALLGLGLPQGPFVASLLAHFALFLAIELATVHRSSAHPEAAR